MSFMSIPSDLKLVDTDSRPMSEQPVMESVAKEKFQAQIAQISTSDHNVVLTCGIQQGSASKPWSEDENDKLARLSMSDSILSYLQLSKVSPCSTT